MIQKVKKNISKSATVIKTKAIPKSPVKFKKNSNLVKRKSEGNQIIKRKSVTGGKATKYEKHVKEVHDRLNVNVDTVQSAVAGVIKFTSENPKLKKQLFQAQFPLLLQVNCIKVPAEEKFSKILRIPLQHSLLNEESEICLIVPDVKGIKNKEHEKHLEHYEALLKTKGVTCIKKIMTFHEFRTEYETFEMKNRLVNLYDMFLVDGRIAGKVVHKCGKIFYQKRKVPTAIKLQATKLKEHIDKNLVKSLMHIHSKGDSFTVQFGHSDMSEKHLVENIYSILDGLDKEFPGGFENIRNLNIYTYRGLSWPIYCSMKSPGDVEIPTIITKKIKGIETVRDELSTILDGEVVVQPTGKVTVKKIKSDVDSELSSSEELDEHLAENNKISKKSSSVNKRKKKTDKAVSAEIVKKQKLGDSAEKIIENVTKKSKRMSQKTKKITV